jgi:acyl-CoA synthetase (AMP-forming)/AMP-acid ligase II
MTNITHRLQEQADALGDQAALIDRHRGQRRCLTYRELLDATEAGASLLTRHGLEPGDTVLFFHPVRIGLYVALLSVLRAGMTAMFIDPSAGRGLIKRCCALHQPKAFFGSPKAHLLRLLVPAIRRIQQHYVTGTWLPGACRWDHTLERTSTNAVVDCENDHPALITFTSGSTGQPKAVARTHRFLLAQHHALERSLSLKQGQVDLITLPVFVLENLASGLTSVLADTDLAKPGAADVDVEAVSQQITEENVERVAASPAFLQRLLTESRSIRPIQHVYTGGAPVFPPLLDALHAAQPTATIHGVYGSTEVEPMADLPYDSITEEDRQAMRSGKGLLVGKPVDEVDLVILPDQWGHLIESAIPCLANTPGEIAVAGDHVLTGYLHGKGDEETKFQSAGRTWHRTGDAGYLDEQGRLWLLGRCSAKIEDTRGTLYPFTVETSLSFMPEIARSAAIQIGTHRVLALEFADKNTQDLSAIQEAVAWASFDDFKVQTTIPVDRRHNAKIDYTALRVVLDV